MPLSGSGFYAAQLCDCSKFLNLPGQLVISRLFPAGPHTVAQQQPAGYQENRQKQKE